jgi:hypothetical protein
VALVLDHLLREGQYLLLEARAAVHYLTCVRVISNEQGDRMSSITQLVWSETISPYEMAAAPTTAGYTRTR